MRIVAILWKIRIQSDAVLGQRVKFDRQGIQLGMYIFELIVYGAMRLLQLAAVLLVMTMYFADHLELWRFLSTPGSWGFFFFALDAYMLIWAMDVNIKLCVRFDGGEGFAKPFMFLGRTSDVNSPSIWSHQFPQSPARMYVRAVEHWGRRHCELWIGCSSRTCEVGKWSKKIARLL